MPELLNIGTGGLLSLQRALATTTNNIVNANTEGYNRQVVNFESLPTQRQGTNFFGSGVTVGSIERVYNSHLAGQARDLSSSYAGNEARAGMLSRLDNLLANSNSGVSQSVQRFFGSLHDLSSNPAGLPEREVVIAEANMLVDQIQTVDDNLRRIGGEVNGRLQQLTTEINDLATSLARVNAKLIEESATRTAPPELLDQRDLLLKQIGERVGITVIDENNNSINVLVGNGQSLVSGGTPFRLGTIRNEFDGEQLEVTYETRPQLVRNISQQISGGEIGGLLEFRERSLSTARDKLGLLVTGLSRSINDTHQLGLDLKGQSGSSFFSESEPLVLQRTTNVGTAALTATIDDIGGLNATSYLVQFDGSQWHVLKHSDNSVVTGSGPFNIDGMILTLTGSAVAGDAFTVQPTRAAAAQLNMEIHRGSEIAAASPLRQLEFSSNLGNAKIDNLQISSTTGIPLGSDIVLTFSPDALGPGLPGFTVTGSTTTTLAYDPATDHTGTTLTLPDEGGLTISMSGVPRTGDQLRIENNTNAAGDNRNLLTMTALQSAKMLDNGTSTYQDSFSKLVAQVGVQTRHATANATTDRLLLNEATVAIASVSGVNLDEEAASLLRYQQAYQAAAQMVAVADNMFQTLLGATSRF